MISPSKKRRRTKRDTEFGASVSSALAEARITQPELASAIGKSVAYTNQVITGRKAPSEEWVNLVADCLRLSEEGRRKMLQDANAQRVRSKFVLPPYKG